MAEIKNKCKIVMDYIHCYYTWFREKYFFKKCKECGKKLD